MARIGTPNLNLGTWEDGENPGAGSQASDSNGLNGDRFKIDTAVGTAHNPDGSHKSAVIDGVNLKSTVPDGVTIEQDPITKKLKVRSSGIATLQLLDDCVTKDKINSDIADGVTIQQNGSGQLAVKANAALRYNLITFSIDALPTSGNTSWMKHQGVTTSASLGVPVSRDGSIGNVIVNDSNHDQVSVSGGTFDAADVISAKCYAIDADNFTFSVCVNGIIVASANFGRPAASVIMSVEIEFD